MSAGVSAFISAAYIPRSGVDELCDNFMFNFFEEPVFSIVTMPFCIPSDSAQRCQSPYIFASTCYFLFWVWSFVLIVPM